MHDHILALALIPDLLEVWRYDSLHGKDKLLFINSDLSVSVVCPKVTSMSLSTAFLYSAKQHFRIALNQCTDGWFEPGSSLPAS